jgi:hypothetical protein
VAELALWGVPTCITVRYALPFQPCFRAFTYNAQYGDANNSSRPGGAMTQAAFVSGSSGTTFHLLADNTTTTSLLDSLRTNCSASLGPSTSTAIAAFDPDQPGQPKPEQAVQYYRASSVVLTLDGYNNTGALSDDDNTPDTPLPPNIDMTLLNCLNQTIGVAVPLVDGASARWAAPGMGMMGLVWVVWFLTSLF